jgi:hypothetical protein
MVFSEEFDADQPPTSTGSGSNGLNGPSVVTPSLRQAKDNPAHGDEMAPIGNHSLPSMFNAFLLDKSKGITSSGAGSAQGGAAAAAAAAAATAAGKGKKTTKKRKVADLMTITAAAASKVAAETPNAAGAHANAHANAAAGSESQATQANKKVMFASNNESLLSMLSLPTFQTSKKS